MSAGEGGKKTMAGRDRSAATRIDIVTELAPQLPPPPPASSRAVRATMRGNKRSGTKPEVALRSVLHRLGLRFRKDYRIRLDGAFVRPDVVFTRQRVAVFVDGCYWHRCPMHGSPGGVKTNTAYWDAKFARNVARDAEQTAALVSAGWSVFRVWEHEDPATVAAEVVAVLQDAAVLKTGFKPSARRGRLTALSSDV